MRFQPVKCTKIQITGKRTNKNASSYILEGTVLVNVDSIRYVGVTVTYDM